MSHDISKLMFSIDCGIRDCVSPLSSWILTQHVIVCGHPLTVSSLLAARAHKALLLALIWFLLLSGNNDGYSAKALLLALIWFWLLSGSSDGYSAWSLVTISLCSFKLLRNYYTSIFDTRSRRCAIYSIRFEFVMISYHRSDSTLHKCVAQRATWSYSALSFMTSSCA